MLVTRKLLATGLAGVMMLITLLDVVAVKCYADNGRHHAIEVVGHQQQFEAACDQQSGCTSEIDHDHDHPAECTDEPLLSDMVSPRAGIDVEHAQPALAIIPAYFDIGALVTIDAASEPQRCPRPPPAFLRASIDGFLTLRLLV